MSKARVRTELLKISDAVSQLEAGMYGGLGQPEPVTEIKKHRPRLSVGWEPRREHASEIIMKMIVTGQLAVYVQRCSTNGQAKPQLLQVPRAILKQMILIRGVMPDYAVRPERFLHRSVTNELAAAILGSALYLRRDEFDSWSRRSREKRNWPSQRPSSKPRIGRPSKAPQELRDRIVGLVNSEQWAAQQNSVAELVRLLRSKGEVPSRQTLERTLKQLHREIGDRRYCTRDVNKADDSVWGSFEDLMDRKRREFDQKMTKRRNP